MRDRKRLPKLWNVEFCALTSFSQSAIYGHNNNTNITDLCISGSLPLIDWKTLVPETLITIGMPVYNAMPYLPEAIESLLSQTFADFELLVVVDGATDGSLAYLQSIRDSRLRLLTQPNLGLVATLNHILHETRTPWLVRQDADDVSYPTRLERIARAIMHYPDAGIFYSLAEYYPRDHAVGSFRCSRGTPAELRKIVQSGYLLSICHPTAVLHVEKTRAIGGYRVGLHAEDADLWWRMALQHDIHCIDEPLVGFRHNPSSISSLNFENQETAGLYIQYLLLSKLWNLTPHPPKTIWNELGLLVNTKAITAKKYLRSFSMHLAEGALTEALFAIFQALCASPNYIFKRIQDEASSSRIIRNGISPSLFLERKDALWPCS